MNQKQIVTYKHFNKLPAYRHTCIYLIKYYHEFH
uniref:Uncharacterized protein n=1 Tax=Rhizophora mucronata TaxID=61149 RepID=A0A2P2NEG2_RHIMU